MRRTESIIALRSEPIKNIFPLLPSIIGPDVRDLIFPAKTICDTPCDCNYLLVFLDLFLSNLNHSLAALLSDFAHGEDFHHSIFFNWDVLWIIWRWCIMANIFNGSVSAQTSPIEIWSFHSGSPPPCLICLKFAGVVAPLLLKQQVSIMQHPTAKACQN